ncbi:MAG: hypothetical protein JWO15_1801 [Sphingomonadales bacterium]|nr:hypothetical protein [Sphingomonadales bacterium]
MEVVSISAELAARLNIHPGWWIMASGNPYVGPFAEREAALCRLDELLATSRPKQ